MRTHRETYSKLLKKWHKSLNLEFWDEAEQIAEQIADIDREYSMQEMRNIIKRRKAHAIPDELEAFFKRRT